MQILLDPGLLDATLRFVTPILLAALGGLLCERAGVFNIALEGTMLAGAFGAVAGSYYAGSALVGTGVAVLAALLLSLLFAVFAVSLRANDIVVGLGINLLAAGATVFLLRTLFGVRGTFRHPEIRGLGGVTLPGIERLPLVGPVLSGHSLIVYASWLAVILLHVALFRHVLGLRLRGVGELPQAASSLGVRVDAVRYGAILTGGALCGLAGAQLSLGNVTLFVENMSAGRGWMAVVAVMLGRATPLGVLGASLLFGFTDALSFRLQGQSLPSQLTEALPYVVTLAALVGSTAIRARSRDILRPRTESS